MPTQPRLVNINVDGGPKAPNTSKCPVGDTCFYGYGGDDEAEADIEQDLSVAPDTNSVLVYNAPNDETGQTELDEYATIANQDIADSISISADADPLTGYAEYCTGSRYVSPNPGGDEYESACLGLTKTPGAPGWFHIGGTSLSAPLFGALFADRDAFQGHRSGAANYLLYALFDNPRTYGFAFHDITGFHQVSNNGFYPVTPGYDQATGIGTPDFAALITIGRR
jgi:subtilase family serine protease